MGAGYALYAKGSKHAELLIYEDVGAGWFGGVSADQFTKDLKALGELSTIDVRINSYGGDVFDGLAIYNQLVQHKARVTTHVDGVAASIASVIAMAGDEIRIAENAWFMIHDAWTMAVGNAADLRRQADLLDSVTDKLAGVYVARTGLPMAEVRELMAAETWLSSDDAVARKFASQIAENLRMAAHAAPDRYSFRHVPAALRPGTAPVAQTASPVVTLSAEDQALRDRLAAAQQRMQRAQLLKDFKTRGAGTQPAA
jgi:ATP-dependent protease ClpP protease subunit